MNLNDPKYLVAFSTLKSERSKLPPTITSAQAGALLNTVALAHAADGWGLLSKPSGNHAPLPGTNPPVFVSSDWLVNKVVHLGVDCLGSGPDFDPPVSGSASPQWGPGEAYDESRFVAPVGSAPPPPADTHVYVGGGNDTGTCDLCGKSRFDAVHAVPQSKVPHTYDGGEQDTGLCDICQKPPSDAIHGSAPPPPPPNSDLEMRVAHLEQTLANIVVDLKAVKQDLAAMHLDIGDLKQLIEHLPTGGGAKVGDPTYVTGIVGLGAVLRGTQVTLEGKIGKKP